jgi:hypothetical protein
VTQRAATRSRERGWRPRLSVLCHAAQAQPPSVHITPSSPMT